MRAVVVGTGAVGARAARQLVSAFDAAHVTVVDVDRVRALEVVAALGDSADARPWDPAVLDGADVAVLAVPGRRPLHGDAALAALERGVHVVSTADDIDAVRGLLELDAEARERRLSVVVAAAFSPGLSCLLASHAASSFDAVEEVHVAKVGTGGPACARQHHRALRGEVREWRDGAWAKERARSGRQLCWFPDPIAGLDCYRANLPEALLLVPAFPGVRRASIRVAATRRDRLSAPLPMLRPPHPEGMLGAVRVEVRGRRGRARETSVLGAIDRPAVAAGAVAATAAAWAAAGRLARPGAAGLAELVDEPVPFLRELARVGIKAAVFEGAAT